MLCCNLPMKHIWKSYHTGNSFCSMTQAVVRRLQVWTEPKILDREAQRWLPAETFVALEKKNCSIKNSFPKSKFSDWFFPVRCLNRHTFLFLFFRPVFLRRVLNVLCSCLDTFLFLECRYRFQELLLQSQLDNRLDNGWGTDYEELILLFV